LLRTQAEGRDIASRYLPTCLLLLAVIVLPPDRDNSHYRRFVADFCLIDDERRSWTHIDLIQTHHFQTSTRVWWLSGGRLLRRRDGTVGGTEIQLGFRITDPAAVSAAGFKDDPGRPPFRWIQVMEISNSYPDAWPHSSTSVIRRKDDKVIDPNASIGTYGEYLLAKVAKVFPELHASVRDG